MLLAVMKVNSDELSAPVHDRCYEDEQQRAFSPGSYRGYERKGIDISLMLIRQRRTLVRPYNNI